MGPRTVAMELVGLKTNEIYRRYDIVDERDLERAWKFWRVRSLHRVKKRGRLNAWVQGPICS